MAGSDVRMVRKRTSNVLQGGQLTLAIGELEGHSKICTARGNSKATYDPGITRRAVVVRTQWFRSARPVSERDFNLGFDCCMEDSINILESLRLRLPGGSCSSQYSPILLLELFWKYQATFPWDRRRQLYKWSAASHCRPVLAPHIRNRNHMWVWRSGSSR
jgi:hypothetical protein